MINIITFFLLDIFGIMETVIKVIMKPIYIPYIITLLISFGIFVILYVRKVFSEKSKETQNKMDALTKLINEKGDSLNAINEFNQGKTVQQFQEFYNAIRKLSNNKIKVKRVKMSNTESALFKRLIGYEKDKYEEIKKLFNTDFKDEHNTDNREISK